MRLQGPGTPGQRAGDQHVHEGHNDMPMSPATPVAPQQHPDTTAAAVLDSVVQPAPEADPGYAHPAPDAI